MKKNSKDWVWWLTLTMLALWEVNVNRSLELQFETSLGSMARPCFYKKLKKSQYSEAEVEGSPEPGRWKLQWAEIVPLHSSLGDRARPCLKKINQNPKNE